MILGNAVSAQDNAMPVLSWEHAEIVHAELMKVNGEYKSTAKLLKTKILDSTGVAGPVTGVHHNMFFVGGGANFPDVMPWLGGKKKYYKVLEVFLPKNDGELVYAGNFELPESTAYGANVSTEYGVVYAGGENENGISKKVLLIQWNISSKKVEITSLPDLPVALTNASMVHDGQYVFLAGGETTKAASDLFLCLDLKNPGKGWKKMPALPKPVSHAVLVKVNNGSRNHLYLIGGRKKNENGISDLYSSVYAFDLNTKKWNQKKSLPYPVSAGTGVIVNDDQVLIFGGDKGETFHRAELLIAALARENDPVKKEQLNKQKIKVQSEHPGFSTEVLRYDVKSDEWKKDGVIPFSVPVTTTAVIWNNFIFIPGGEVRAGVRSPNILSGRLGSK